MRRNILITGASSGLGAEMARQFVARGHHVALCARRVDRLRALQDSLLSAHPSARVAIAELDVDDHDSVFTVFRGFDAELGGLDRVIVNAGTGDGYPIGTGRFAVNKATAVTNFVSALAQCEAAMELFRARNAGHLVVISSFSANRGMRRHGTTYAATKAGLATLAEGIRADTLGTPIRVTTIFPGTIRTEMTATAGRTPFITSTPKAVTAMVNAIQKEPTTATVPAWPWLPLAWIARLAPLRIASRIK